MPLLAANLPAAGQLELVIDPVAFFMVGTFIVALGLLSVHAQLLLAASSRRPGLVLLLHVLGAYTFVCVARPAGLVGLVSPSWSQPGLARRPPHLHPACARRLTRACDWLCRGLAATSASPWHTRWSLPPC